MSSTKYLLSLNGNSLKYSYYSISSKCNFKLSIVKKIKLYVRNYDISVEYKCHDLIIIIFRVTMKTKI